MLHVDDDKWRDLAKELAADLGEGAQFDRVYLIDDFTASGTTFIRQRQGEWKGKLTRFNRIIATAREDLGKSFPIVQGFALHIHHYISSYQARDALKERLEEAQANWADKEFGTVEATEGILLPDKARLNEQDDPEILGLCERYYDHEIFTRYERHCRESGQENMKFGYADCALPVVLAHNTPNNSIPLLWAETDGKNGAHPMRPVFRRRDRHG